MQSDDVIIINSDRSITFNGKTVKLGAHINEWIKVLGDNYRAGRYKTGYNWDNLGISISIKSDKGDDKEAQITNSFNIQLITFLEMFPRYKSETYKDFDFKKENGGVSQFYFKGLIRIEDGYLSRETSYDEFRKSDISKTFRNTFSRPSTYKRGFLDENKFSYKRIYIDLMHTKFVKRISISASMTKEELKEIKRKAKKELEK